MASQPIETLVKFFAKMPGLGPRSARRFVLHLLKEKKTKLLPLIEQLTHTANNISTCSECGNIDISDPCSICSDTKRNPHHICVVENVADLWAIERSGGFNGLYHVLGGTLSALDGIGPEELKIPYLKERIEKHNVTEVVLALNATLEGQTTNHYLASELDSPNIQITSIAHGVPMGGELDYLDSGTLVTALSARRSIYTQQE